MRLRRFIALWAARNREFLRDRAALGWNVIFPVLVVAGLAFAFTGGPADLYKVGVFGAPGGEPPAFLETRYVDFIPVDDLGRAITRVERHQLAMVVDLHARRYWVNDTSPQGYMAERVLLGGEGEGGFVREAVSGQQIRYVDWVVPGVLAMNMMFSALYGVGYVVVRYRKNGVLKRLRATPLTAFEFLTAQVASRLWLLLAVTAFVYVGTDLFLGFPMYGAYFDLLLVATLGAISMISLGLVIASRLASEELAEGLLNLISWPMIFLSGVWFSLEGAHPALQQFALIFPLTHLIDAARAIMIDGAGLVEVAPQLVVLTVMSAVFLAIGSYLFRWE